MKSKLWLMGLILAGSIFCQDVSAWTWDNFTSELRSRNVYPKSGNIGIGSSSPRAKLDVDGSAYIDGYLTLTGSISNNSTSGVGIITDKAVYIGGNVGIGTTSAAQALHVEGAVYFGAGNVGINTVSPLAQLSVKNNNTTPLMVSKTGSGDLLIVTSAGNVGIGTTAPRQLLDVDGAVYMKGNVGIGSASPSEKLFVDGNIYGLKIAVGRTVSTIHPLAVRTTSATAGMVITSSLTTNSFSVYPSSDGNSYLISGAGHLFLNSTNAGNVGIGTNTSPSQKLHVKGNSYFNGNVGIGSSSPRAALDINGGAAYLGSSGIGYVTCVTTDGYRGHCTAGTFPNCTTCVKDGS